MHMQAHSASLVHIVKGDVHVEKEKKKKREKTSVVPCSLVGYIRIAGYAKE